MKLKSSNTNQAAKMQQHFHLLILTLAAVCMIQVQPGIGSPTDLVYACWPNETLKIQNPGSYQGIFANNSNTICNTTASDNLLFFYVTGCPQNVTISVTFSNYSRINSGILGGKQEVEMFLITCLQLPASGVFRSVSAAIDPLFRSANQTGIYPEFNLTSVIYIQDHSNGRMYDVLTANIGQHLVWIIDADEDNLILRPELCTAYPGRDLSAVTNETNRKVISELGCSTDDEIASKFNQSINDTTITATFYAFRFFESEFVTIECDVRVCPDSSTACDIDCPGDRRRRENPVEDKTEFLGLTKAVAKVRILVNSSSKECSWGWMVTLAVILVFCGLN